MAFACKAASAHEATRDFSESARLVWTIGAAVPSTIPAHSPFAKYTNCLYKRLPASRLGTRRMSGRSELKVARPLICAASIDIATSKASGSSTRAPVICPRCAILLRAAASNVPGIAGLMVSTAESTPTYGRSTPRICARSIAFCAISRLSIELGAILTTQSAINRGLEYAARDEVDHQLQVVLGSITLGL